jgi:hypothetical protein
MEIDPSGGALCSASVGAAVEIHDPETSIVMDEEEEEEGDIDCSDKCCTSPQRKVTFDLPGDEDVVDGGIHPYIGYFAVS